jgi:peptidoglycan/LPS O-acetylase OafA/YrhL
LIEEGAQARLPALDGCRAIAVAVVVAYHTTYAPGGAGVDFFFVLTGFLLTVTVMRSVPSGRSLRGHLTRHALRTLPPYFFFLAIATALTFLLAPPAQLGGWLAEVPSAMVMAYNFRAVAAPIQNPMLAPVWMLAVLEQYFVLWSVLLWGLLAARVPRRALLVLVLALAIAGAAWRSWAFLDGFSVARIYFGSDMHVDAFMTGALMGGLYLGARLRSESVRRFLEVAGGPLGIAIVLVDLLVSKSSPWLLSGGNVIYITACAIAVAVCAVSPSRRAMRVLSHPLAVRAGEASFAIYLWHMPAFAIVAAMHPGRRFIIVGIGLVLTAAFTAITYLLVERPLQVRRRRAAHGRQGDPGMKRINESEAA